MVLLGAIAGLLVGVLTARPLLFIVIGIIAGIGLGLLVRPKKKACCQ